VTAFKSYCTFGGSVNLEFFPFFSFLSLFNLSIVYGTKESIKVGVEDSHGFFIFNRLLMKNINFVSTNQVLNYFVSILKLTLRDGRLKPVGWSEYLRPMSCGKS
jgi:hypothetical protein